VDFVFSMQAICILPRSQIKRESLPRRTLGHVAPDLMGTGFEIIPSSGKLSSQCLHAKIQAKISFDAEKVLVHIASASIISSIADHASV
jgi:hypothetical protein